MGKIRLNASGFTLIELILVISIIGIVISMASGSIVHIFKTIPPSSERINAKQMAEITLMEISSYVRNDKNTIEFIEEDKEIIIKDSSDNRLRTFINIKHMTINESNNIHKITIEKCIDENCSDFESVTTKVTKRN